jgi:hypothetical protein
VQNPGKRQLLWEYLIHQLTAERKKNMILKEQIIRDVNTIADLQLLNQLFDYVQVIKRTVYKITPNRERVLQSAGSINDKEAQEVKQIIANEFNQTEGDW